MTIVNELLTPIDLGGVTAANRVMFGPHVTNLGDDDRALTDRHVAYYRRRAEGGAGIIVIEGASVHQSDWPSERAPLAEACSAGWAAITEVCRAAGSVVIASLDHAGGQGSSAYSQAPLWAPSRVPEVNSREVPKWMETGDIDAVIAGFATAAAAAVAAGCDGVEINIGQHSLIRQFLSGLTNHRDDAYGTDRVAFARAVLEAVRAAIGNAVLGIRFSADELAPWAGITPEMATGLAVELVDAPSAGDPARRSADYLVVTRGSIFSVDKTRPDFHEAPMFNAGLCSAVREAVAGRCAVLLQGSVIDPVAAADAIADGVADAVEMTRAQIADPDLVAKLVAGTPERIRPCTLCNQLCQVRDARNPIVSCVVEPSAGNEHRDPDWYEPTHRPRQVVVVGAGPAGLECARVAATIGHRVRIVEQRPQLGGIAAVAGPHRLLIDWLAAESARLGVTIDTGVDLDPIRPDGGSGGDVGGDVVLVQATGSVPGRPGYRIDDDAIAVIDIAAVRLGEATVPETGRIVIVDPIGGPIGVAIAEELGERAVLVTQDNIAGNELARTGDLAPANTRLAQRGVVIERRTLMRRVTATGVVVEDRFSGQQRTIDTVAVIDCGFRLPTEAFAIEPPALAAGDCVAPRTVAEAILEGRRAAVAIAAAPATRLGVPTH